MRAHTCPIRQVQGFELNRSIPVLLAVAFLLIGFWAYPDIQEIAAGLAMFLLGMSLLEQGFQNFSGGALERILERATASMPKALGLGIVATALMQSSSLITVITISFLSAGMITLLGGIGIIFGANIGTTTGAWLIAGIGLKIDIAAYALPMIAISGVLGFAPGKYLAGSGRILGGIGFLFLGIYFMKEGFDGISGNIDLARLAMTGALGLIVYAVVGAMMTVVMQSSHATLVLTITALAAGQITYENALALAIGSNVGTTVTALIGAISANYQGRRLALAHLLFNGITATVALVFIKLLAGAVQILSDAVGIATDDFTLRLAMFHTLFNVLGVSLMLPFARQLVTFLEHRIPAPKVDISVPHFLSEDVLRFPETAEAALRNEIRHLLTNTTRLAARNIGIDIARLRGSPDIAAAVSAMPFTQTPGISYETRIKPLYGAILEFAARLNAGEMPPAISERLFELREAAGRLSRAAKDAQHLHRNTEFYATHSSGKATRLYDDLRTQIARILIELDDMAEADPESRSSLWLDDERVEIRRHRAQLTEDVEQAIRDERISTTAATSFLNDARTAHHLMDNLLEAARVCYAETDPALAQVEQLLTIEEDEAEAFGQDQIASEKETHNGPTQDNTQT